MFARVSIHLRRKFVFMPPVKTAVVGVGHLGSLHARIYSRLPKAELVGVYDIDPDRAAECAARNRVRAFSTLEEVARSVKAVSLAVPTDSHYELGKFILKQGLHLLVEKPITEREEQAEELVEIAKSKGLVLAVGHVERFNPALVAAAEHISNPLFVESERLAPFNPRGTEVPVVLDLMIHDIDIVLSLIRQPVLTIQAMGVPVLTTSVDIANARLSFEGGAVANVAASRVSIKKSRKMRFFSTDSYVSVDMLKHSAVAYRKRPGAEIPLDRGTSPALIPDMLSLVERKKLAPDKKREPLAVELADFLLCVTSGKRPVVSGFDGLQALQVADRILKAIDQSLASSGLKT